MELSSTIREKKERLEDQTIYDVLAAFTNLCISKKEVPYFKRNTEKIHRFFYKEAERNPEVFQEVVFDTRGLFPYCGDVEHVFNTLEYCKMLCSWGLRFDPHQFRKKILNIYKRIDSEVKSKVEDIAQRFYQEFICDESGNHGKVTCFNKLEDLF